MERHSFHAMGTEVEVLLDVAPGPDAVLALASAETEFERLEGLLSRFRPESELSRLNARGAIEASDDLLAVVELALDARDRTDGRFDPTVHDAVVAAGYDRSFEELEHAARAQVTDCYLRSARTSPPVRARSGGRVRIRGRRLVLEDGARLDLGGIGKGYAVDRAVAHLGGLGPCLANAGGDLAVSGLPAGGMWPVAVELPAGRLTVGLAAGGIATSGRDRRRWRVGDEERHHLIDPGTGRSSSSDLVSVTVAAESAVEAEVWAKALFLAGEEAAALEADTLRLPAVLVAGDGRVRSVGGLT
jgi:thiamine biosynthesis lipoprotein